MKILFWNTGGRDVRIALNHLDREHEPDVIVLAEAGHHDPAYLEALNDGTKRTFLAPWNPSERLRFLVRYPPKYLSLEHDDRHFSIRRVAPPNGKDILLVGVHLRSKLHAVEQDQAHEARRVRQAVEERQARVGHCRTLIIGDFNMDPFEPGLAAADAFHGIMDRQIVGRRSRKVMGEDWQMFYNPAWSGLGDRSAGPPGTYYDGRGGSVCYFWHSFDQALLSADLVGSFGNFAVLTKAGDREFLNKGRIDIDRQMSDHLPIVVDVNVEDQT